MAGKSRTRNNSARSRREAAAAPQAASAALVPTRAAARPTTRSLDLRPVVARSVVSSPPKVSTFGGSFPAVTLVQPKPALAGKFQVAAVKKEALANVASVYQKPVKKAQVPPVGLHPLDDLGARQADLSLDQLDCNKSRPSSNRSTGGGSRSFAGRWCGSKG